MSKLSDRLTTRKEKDVKILADFVSIFCRENHRDANKSVFQIMDEELSRILSGKGHRTLP